MPGRSVNNTMNDVESWLELLLVDVNTGWPDRLALVEIMGHKNAHIVQ